MSPNITKQSTKSQSQCDRTRLQQNRRRRKKTLTNKLREYCDECDGDVYLLVADRMSENLRHYSVVKFTVDPSSMDSFPPPDQNLVCVICFCQFRANKL
jgi:hypothetical protein